MRNLEEQYFPSETPSLAPTYGKGPSTSTTTLRYVAPVVAASAFICILLAYFYYCEKKLDRSAEESDFHEEIGSHLAKTKNNTDTSANGPFLSGAEKWERAKIIFPGIIHPDSKYNGNPRRSVEDQIWGYIEDKYKALWRDESLETMEDLMTPERGAELCIKLGINEMVVRKRFDAISNLRSELGISSMTSTIIQVRHLVSTFGVSNPYGAQEDINDGKSTGTIQGKYKGKDWQSYLGIRLQPGKCREAISVMNEALKKENLTNCFTHGTNGKALQGIDDDEGFLNESVQLRTKNGIRHDFGSGLYASKGSIVKALAWGVDTLWPLFNDQTNRFTADPNTPTGHNPAIVVFPEPKQYNKREKPYVYFDVHKKVSRKFQKDFDHEEDHEEFINKRKNYGGSESDRKWKSFVKLARYYAVIPRPRSNKGHVFFGRMHHPHKTYRTDQCHEPIMDQDTTYIQYCFTNPNSQLGKERLFIEFDVDWNLWLSDLATVAVPAGTTKGDHVRKLTKNRMEKQVSVYDK